MIKMNVFNKINDKLIVDTFKNILQRRSSEVFQVDIPEFRQSQFLTTSCVVNNSVNFFEVFNARATVDQFQECEDCDETTAEMSDPENAKTARRTKHKRVF